MASLQMQEHIQTYRSSHCTDCTAVDVRRPVFQYAVDNKLSHPFNDKTKPAGKNWFTAVSKKNSLSVRRPEGLFRARAAEATDFLFRNRTIRVKN
jgi:hypothetical protein